MPDQGFKNLLITGAAGFIGSHVVRHWSYQHPETRLVSLDKLTYAGHKANLSGINSEAEHHFVQADIADRDAIQDVFQRFEIDGVMNLAAESHVDRSITSPSDFIQTNIQGTAALLDVALNFWNLEHPDAYCFFQISTDEVYGSLGSEGYFDEQSPYKPRSPYAASKASADHLVQAYYHTYGLPVKISNCSNNYGPYQYPEKLIPLMIQQIRAGKPLPVYGEGRQIRDWLYVQDHVEALDSILYNGSYGESYVIGANNEWSNLDLVYNLCRIMDEYLEQPAGTAEKLITFVKDRAGHDFRYALDASKLKQELGWQPKVSFERGLRHTVDWYLKNKDWIKKLLKDHA